MLESAVFQEFSSYKPQKTSLGRSQTYAENPRTAGKMPVWNAATTSKSTANFAPTPHDNADFSRIFSQALAQTQASEAIQADAQQASAQHPAQPQAASQQTESPPSTDAPTIAPPQSPAQESAQTEESFGFGDLLDMINPLHHIPLVNIVYRNLSGDTIKPIGKIIGGAAFGGPLGLASSLAGIVIDTEFGDKNQAPPAKATKHAFTAPEDPATANTVLAFADLKQAPDPRPLHMTRQYND